MKNDQFSETVVCTCFRKEMLLKGFAKLTENTRDSAYLLTKSKV